jgi:hypothetical protein
LRYWAVTPSERRIKVGACAQNTDRRVVSST